MEVARVELNRALEISGAFFPVSLTVLNESGHLRYAEVIGQGAASNFQFGQCAVIIPVSPIKILRTRQVRFTCIRTKPRSCLNGRLCERQTRGRMIDVIVINVVMSKSELAVGIEKLWITCDSLVQQIHCLQ